MAYNGTIFAGTLFDINVAASGALAVLNPLLFQIDLTLFGSLGLGAFQANLQMQLSAALNASISIKLPNLQALLNAILELEAALMFALEALLPQVNVSFNVMADFALALSVQLGGIELLLQAALAIKIPAMTFAASLEAALCAGPLFVLSFEDISLASAGASIAGDFGAGLLHGQSHILPGEHVYGIVLVTKAVSAWTALSATMLVA